MAKYRPVYTTFWTDAKIVDDFTPNDKLLMLYFLTNQYTNLCGCYEISFNQIALDTGIPLEEVKQLVKKHALELKTIEYDYDTKELFVKNWYKYNWTNSTKIEAGINRELQSIKSEVFKQKLSDLIATSDTLSKKNDTLPFSPYIYTLNNINNIILGKYKRIVILQEDYNKLILDYSKDIIDNQILLLDEYLESNNNKYNYTNFDLILRKSLKENWFKNKKPKKEPEWLGKEIESLPTTKEEQERMQNMISGFKN